MLSRVELDDRRVTCRKCGEVLVARVFEWVMAETLMEFGEGPPHRVAESEVSWEDAQGISHVACNRCGAEVPPHIMVQLTKAMYGGQQAPQLHIV